MGAVLIATAAGPLVKTRNQRPCRTYFELSFQQQAQQVLADTSAVERAPVGAAALRASSKTRIGLAQSRV
jgi:hypothetical protein